MNFDDFHSSFVKENRKLKWGLALSLIIFSIGTLSLLLEKRYFMYKGKEIFEERPLAEEICRLSFVSIAEGEPNSHIVTQEIIDLIKEDPFTIEIDKILLLKSTAKNTCRIVFRSKKTLMSFKIILKDKSSYPFYYKLSELNETPIHKELL